MDKFGIKHTKGILLYGPPGTGKTLIARKISEALNCEKPLIVNGPELNSKYVGEAEKNMRALFEPAEKEQEQKKCCKCKTAKGADGFALEEWQRSGKNAARRQCSACKKVRNGSPWTCHGGCGQILTKDDFSSKMQTQGNKKQCKQCVKKTRKK